MLPTIATGNVSSALAGEYEVANSCRFDRASSSKLSKSISSSGNRKTWTWSAWIKRGNLPGATADLFGTPYTSLAKGSLYFDTSERLYYSQYESGGASNNVGIRTNRVFRDTSAWFHICLIWDTTNSTGDDRIRLYINGTRETDLGVNTNPSLNIDGVINNSSHDLLVAGDSSYASLFFDGYMCEVVFIDGQALLPDNFGEFDSDSPNIWKPKDVSDLTFGTNGFYLDFEDSSALGNDVSGNNNDFTVNNLTSVDQSTDTCTNNFATYNPLQVQVGAANEPIFREGNLNIHGSSTGSIHFHAPSTIGVTQGKWYAEFKGGSSSNENGLVGVTYDPGEDARNDDYPGQQSHSYGYFVNGNKYTGDSGTSYGDAWTTDIIGVALDLDNHKLYFSKNGVFQDSGDPTSGSTGTGAAFSLTTGKTYFFATGDGNATYINPFEANFGGTQSFTISSGNTDANGHGNFEYAVPSGYFALCTKNLSEFG